MKSQEGKVPINKIDWRLYLRQLLETRSFRDVQARYVPIKVEPPHFGKRHEPKYLSEVVENHPKIIVLGEPGAGKSWTLRQLALNEADKILRGEDADSRIPIYTELKDWITSQDSPAQQRESSSIDMLQFLLRSMQRVQFTLPTDVLAEARLILENALQSSTFMFIFDGLDEIRNALERKRFVDALADFHYKFRETDHKYVISSRKYGFIGEVSEILKNEGFEIFEITKPDNDIKTEILETYLAPDLYPGEVLTSIKTNYRVARLSDNILLLSLMASSLADEYDPEGESLQTRGRILQRHIDKCIEAAIGSPPQPAKAEVIKELLTILALDMRKRGRRDLSELKEVAPMVRVFLNENPLRSVENPEDFLSILLDTRLIQRQAGVFSEISFALPQYEDYFLARKVFWELREALQNGSSAKIGGLQYIRDREWHHVLIMAAGLLEKEDAEGLARRLDDRAYLLLKARILGEAVAPLAEKEFITNLKTRLNKSLHRTLKSLSRHSLGILLFWLLGFLPLAFALNWLWAERPWTTVAGLVGYLVGLPLVFRLAHPLLFRHHVDQVVQGSLPDVLSALVCLRTGVVARELENFCDMVEGQIPWDEDEEDVFVQFIGSVSRELEHAIDLSNQDPDTVWSEIEENPALIQHWLVTPPEAFSADDVEILERFLNKHDPKRLRIQIRCVKKLAAVAVRSPLLRDQIRAVLERIISEETPTIYAHFSVAPRLAHATEQAIKYINEAIKPKQPSSQGRRILAALIATLGGTAIFFFARVYGGLAGLWLFICMTSLIVLLLLTQKFGEGENLLQKINRFKWFFGGWFLAIVILSQFMLPEKIFNILQRFRQP